MLPSFRSVRRLLQTKGPSGSRLNSSTLRIGFWVLSTVRRLMRFTAMDAREKPKLAYLLGRNSWVLTLNTLCIFQGLPLCQFWMVQAGWASPQVEKRNFSHPEQAEISTLKIKLGDLPRWVKAAWNKDPHKVENWHCILACHVRQANQFLESSECKVETSNAKEILKHLFSGKHLGPPTQFE